MRGSTVYKVFSRFELFFYGKRNQLCNQLCNWLSWQHRMSMSKSCAAVPVDPCRSPPHQVGICCDSGLEPEPQRLAECWEEAFQALRKAAEFAMPEVTNTVVAQAV